MSFQKVSVRPAEEKDVEQVVELIVRLKSVNEEVDLNFKVVENIYEVVRGYVRDSLSDDKAVILVAEDEENGSIVGVIRFHLVDRIFYEPRIKAEITDFYIKPVYRRKRLGSTLLHKAIEVAKQKGAGIVTAFYPAGNIIADTFYEREKFIPLNKEKYIKC
ncbi:MAG: GNAT family N-acetyltransferase [Caldisphaeraceae archaeon]|nr:GNAT family N-acetyltransferase [Caldisphaeraceae archaeon]